MVDGLYAALGAAGVSPLLLVGPVRIVLGIVGAGVLGWLGLRTLFCSPPGRCAPGWRSLHE